MVVIPNTFPKQPGARGPMVFSPPSNNQPLCIRAPFGALHLCLEIDARQDAATNEVDE